MRIECGGSRLVQPAGLDPVNAPHQVGLSTGSEVAARESQKCHAEKSQFESPAICVSASPVRPIDRCRCPTAALEPSVRLCRIYWQTYLGRKS